MSPSGPAETVRVGFTGTRYGMTPEQEQAVVTWLRHYNVGEAHHGDCVGADATFHKLAQGEGLAVTVHPPFDSSKRAYCEGDCMLPQQPYLIRNRHIVDDTDVLIATPAEWSEQSKGGTWYTVRYARRQGKTVHVIWPNGDGVRPAQFDGEEGAP